jgi:hypothetical protein
MWEAAQDGYDRFVLAKKDKIGFDEQGRQFEANNCAGGCFAIFHMGPDGLGSKTG